MTIKNIDIPKPDCKLETDISEQNRKRSKQLERTVNWKTIQGILKWIGLYHDHSRNSQTDWSLCSLNLNRYGTAIHDVPDSESIESEFSLSILTWCTAGHTKPDRRYENSGEWYWKDAGDESNWPCTYEVTSLNHIRSEKSRRSQICIHYLTLDNLDVQDSHLIPVINKYVRSLENAMISSTLECKSGHWQIRLKKGWHRPMIHAVHVTSVAFKVRGDAVWTTECALGVSEWHGCSIVTHKMAICAYRPRKYHFFLVESVTNHSTCQNCTPSPKNKRNLR